VARERKILNAPLRVGIIGVGPISDWHVRAIRAAGMEVAAVTTRPGSARLEDFAGRHAISRVYAGWEEMLARGEELDAVVIATRPDGTPEILDAFLPLGIPILVEKPVAWSSERIARLATAANDKVIVGFNRRFYRPVEAARAEAQGGEPLLVFLTLPEQVVPPQGEDPDRLYVRPFFENSCHGIDLVRYLIGELRIESVRILSSAGGHIGGISATLSSARGDVVSFLGNWGAPANYAISLHRPGRRFDLLPFEAATVYEGMDVVAPTDEWPIRRYVPRELSRIHLDEIDRTEKPGFVAQARALRMMAEGRPIPSPAATLEDARAVVALCESLAGVRYGT
jgi:predicted dehydrogenase